MNAATEEPTSMSIAELDKLAALEAVVEKNFKSFTAADDALTKIRDGKLYRADYDTFEDYCQKKWGMTRQYANRLIVAADVVANLETIVAKPTSEAQAKPLANLPAEEQATAWTEAVETAPEGKVTAKHVAEVVARRKREDEDESGKEFAANAPLRALQAAHANEPQPEPGATEEYEQVESLQELIAANKKFACIMADPPWKYGNQATRAATDNHYETMTVEEIAALPIGELAADRAHLWLWTTNGFLFECPKLFSAWGFEFKSSYVWVKSQMGIGNYLRNSHEILLLAVRGGMTASARNVMSWGEFPRTKHSAKPEEIRTKVVEQISPGPRLELFGRRKSTGWTVWGNQIEKEPMDGIGV